MAIELIAGTSQLCLVSLDAECSNKFSPRHHWIVVPGHDAVPGYHKEALTKPDVSERYAL